MGFHLYSSNQLDVLAEHFEREVYLGINADVLAPETVVVQTGGMAAYLQQYLAGSRNTGICANIAAPFLENFIMAALPALLPEKRRDDFKRDAELFSREVLTWRIHDLLAKCPAEYPELAACLADNDAEHGVLKLHQLAEQLAAHFDRYQVHRPELLRGWLEPGSSDDSWQARLYRALCSENRRGREYYFDLALQGKIKPRPGELPGHVTLFGIGAIAKRHLELFRKLSESIDVYMFYLNPCSQYWSYLYSKFEKARRLESGSETSPENFDTGNPLLAELGRQGRDFHEETFDVIDRAGLPGEEDFRPWIDSEHPTSMLRRMQNDILMMEDRSASPPAATPTGTKNAAQIAAIPAPSAPDRSVSVYNCHGKRRELEVLCDQLLQSAADFDLDPRDIIVMAPNIDEYAPLIPAVFDSTRFAGRYAVTDRTLGAASPSAETLLALLELTRGRCEASAVFAIAASAPVAEKFSFGANDLPELERFVRAAEIHWGEDASSRRENCGVEFSEFSWREGLDRLMLGFAVDENAAAELPDPAPVGVPDGGRADLLGRFIYLVNRIFDFRREFRHARTPLEWGRLLTEAVDFLFPVSGERADETRTLRNALWAPLAAAKRAGFTGEIPVGVIIDHLGAALRQPVGNQAFLRGKLTFCSLVPMRSIPARVVAILGLDNQAFPRRDIKIGFDLMTAHLPGDRSRPDEDRYLFLEALLAARDRLMLFYSGQSPLGEPDAPPAMPLAGVIDYLAACEPDFKVVKQRLQAFSPDYFIGTNRDFQSYRRSAAATAAALVAGTGTLPAAAPFAAASLIATPDEPAELTLDQFTVALTNPCRCFIETNTEIPSRDFASEWEDDESFDLPGTVRREIIGRAVFSTSEDTGDLESCYRELRRRRALPGGHLGRRRFMEVWQSFQNAPAKIVAACRNAGPLVIGFEFNQLMLTGTTTGTPDTGKIVEWNFSGAYPETLVGLRLRHLALTLQRNLELAAPTRLIVFTEEGAEVSAFEPLPPSAARLEMAGLLEVWRDARRRALPLFPAASSAFATTAAPEQALAKARAAFCDDHRGFAEKDDAAIRRFFTETSFGDAAFQAEFSRLSKLVYGSIQHELLKETIKR